MSKVITLFLLVIVFISCSSPKEKEHASTEKKEEHKKAITKPVHAPDTIGEVCWKGLMNKKIPVFIHYSFHNNLIIGEIVYLKTKAQTPIRLIGDIRDDHFRLVEYDKQGNVTGVIIGNQTYEDKFEGRWTNLMDGDIDLDLSRIDTSFAIPSIDHGDITGDYAYSYGEKMEMGKLHIERLNDTQTMFDILCIGMGEAPSRAQVEKDTVALSAEGFTYQLPEAANCEFTVTFYKDFAYVKYTQSDCTEQFGMNVGVDGIYIKKE